MVRIIARVMFVLSSVLELVVPSPAVRFVLNMVVGFCIPIAFPYGSPSDEELLSSGRVGRSEREDNALRARVGMILRRKLPIYKIGYSLAVALIWGFFSWPFVVYPGQMWLRFIGTFVGALIEELSFSRKTVTI